MRAVERTPWAERRNEAHDALCLSVATDPVGWVIAAGALKPLGAPLVRVEHPCGPGFLDVLVETDERLVAWLFEVKTDAERSSAGDVIRQLRWYAANLPGKYTTKHLVCVCENEPTETFSRLLRAAGIIEVVAGIRRAVQCKDCHGFSHKQTDFSAPKSDAILMEEARAMGWEADEVCPTCMARRRELLRAEREAVQ